MAARLQNLDQVRVRTVPCARGYEQYRLGEPRNRREKLGDEARAKDEAEVPVYLLYPHGLLFLFDKPYEALRQSSPAEALHAVAAHGLLAPLPLFSRRREVL